ncbi:MAG: glycerol-3-phosphate 1-O-acyltransferase PlsY [Vicinamibacteria bacterium]|nr:glycerol-3-phosphate 1-O-acyltransferase PlsY [Vicinamibacteria bacterium]
MTLALLVLLGYAIGSIPSSFLVARLFGVKDVRTVGSGNVGATNVMRSAGKVPGVLALLLDASKGAVTVLLARAATASEVEVCVAGLFAVIGHLFPVWLGFRGGKGVATGAGLFLPLAPTALGAAVLVFIAAVATFRYVSLASILASLSLPVAAYLLGASFAVVTTAAAAALMVVVKHHANIGRLMRGAEPKLGAPKPAAKP